ncbi:hypothetical protein KY289_025826 [Solanum tuberosum]|nr:hypothetical protein KY289_025826 [Solanum tuberosum]
MFLLLLNLLRSDKLTKDQSVASNKKAVHPKGRFLQKWNKAFMLAYILSVSLDPLFFYIPVIDNNNKCLDLDKTGEFIEDSSAIAKRYLSSYFMIDVITVLPLPQIVILIIAPNVNGPIALLTKEMLKIVIFAQYVPRFCRIIPLYKEVERTSIFFNNESAWGGTAFYIFLFMWSSNVIGAFWYLFSIERQYTCWRSACEKIPNCSSDYLYCGGKMNGNAFLLNSSCPLLQQEDMKDPNDFDFGIALDALQFQVVMCLEMAIDLLYPLHSLGQNLKTSTFDGDIIFAIVISLIGLIFFSLIIGNMQKLMQFNLVRVEEMRVRRCAVEQWMSHRMLPLNLRQRIRRHEQYKWQETRGVEEDSLIQNLPRDLRRDLKRHLCWSLLKRAVTDIEVFAITADDLKFVASQFRRLHSKQLQHTYKFFSQEWRTWAACFIQVAWRRHCRKKLEKSLREEEDKVQVALAKEGTNASSLGATIYASRFAAKVLRSLRCNNTTGAKSSPTLPLLLHKPAEPDFSKKKLFTKIGCSLYSESSLFGSSFFYSLRPILRGTFSYLVCSKKNVIYL